ncbi:hypothetical protein PtB15_13B281 [Puccinia triticina]|nr:hypothetical protein PtB15_13B281 [Puccinia triticina]
MKTTGYDMIGDPALYYAVSANKVTKNGKVAGYKLHRQTHGGSILLLPGFDNNENRDTQRGCVLQLLHASHSPRQPLSTPNSNVPPSGASGDHFVPKREHKCPATSTSNASHHPNNLENLYGTKAVSESPEDESGVHSLPMVAQDSAMGSKAATVADPAAEEKPMVPCPSSIGHSKHNPRSPSFNVEHALADAMSEQSIGSLATLEFVRSHSSTELSRSDTSGRRQTQIGCKDLYRGRGRKGNMVRYI